ncbi:hypothetical protein, partial [Mycobacteroides abscessus]
HHQTAISTPKRRSPETPDPQVLTIARWEVHHVRVLLLVLALLGVAYAAALAVARNNMEVWHTAAGEGP